MKQKTQLAHSTLDAYKGWKRNMLAIYIVWEMGRYSITGGEHGGFTLNGIQAIENAMHWADTHTYGVALATGKRRWKQIVGI